MKNWLDWTMLAWVAIAFTLGFFTHAAITQTVERAQVETDCSAELAQARRCVIVANAWKRQAEEAQAMVRECLR